MNNYRGTETIGFFVTKWQSEKQMATSESTLNEVCSPLRKNDNRRSNGRCSPIRCSHPGPYW